MNRTALAFVLTAGLVVTSCSGGGDEATATTPAPVETTVPDTEPTTTTIPRTTTSTSSTTTTTTVPDVLRMPLTGEPIEDASAIPDRPALVVKISNYPQGVIPQAGLNSADIVFEEVINDGATRLAAVYHSQGVDPVGPIRSGRAQDINLLRSLKRPLYAWSGGNAAVTRAIRESDLIDLERGQRLVGLLPPFGAQRRQHVVLELRGALGADDTRGGPADTGFSVPPRRRSDRG